MGAAVLKKQFEAVLGGHLDWQSRPAPDLLPSGIAEIDAATGGIPRGCLTEIVGPASSGRTSLAISILAAATAHDEICAVVDSEDAFDPLSAAAAGVDLARIVWIRSNHNAEQALKAADLLLQGGGFGLVLMDLGDTPPITARRISLTSWFRLRRAVEHTPTALLVIGRQSNAKTCASLTLDCRRERIRFSGAGPGRLLRASRVLANSTERSRVCSPVFTATAI
jgi:hypothetical protein